MTPNRERDLGDPSPDEGGDTAIHVGRKPYDEFCLWLDGELEKLVARWAHTAAPQAGRLERILRRRRG
jgi:hypothetical protein